MVEELTSERAPPTSYTRQSWLTIFPDIFFFLRNSYQEREVALPAFRVKRCSETPSVFSRARKISSVWMRKCKVVIYIWLTISWHVSQCSYTLYRVQETFHSLSTRYAERMRIILLTSPPYLLNAAFELLVAASQWGHSKAE